MVTESYTHVYTFFSVNMQKERYLGSLKKLSVIILPSLWLFQSQFGRKANMNIQVCFSNVPK